jgi:hypothetical protein
MEVEMARSAAKQAMNSPVITSKETDTREIPLTQPTSIEMPVNGKLAVQEPEKIAVLDKPLENDYLDALKFNEEIIEIMLQPSSEENAAMVVDVYVNGEARWIPVGPVVPLKRKFVEVLMRSKPVSIQTDHESRDSGAKVINNKIIRNARAKYPLSIMNDPNPKGREWVNRIMREVA